MIERDKILQFLHNNISNNSTNQKINYEFDMKFELSRVDTLKEKIKSLETDLEEYKSIIEREKNEKRKIIGTYN
jgi:hypothetical protein